MKMKRIFLYFIIFFAFAFLLSSCTQLEGKNNDKVLADYINVDTKSLGNLPQDYKFVNQNRVAKENGIDINYTALTGVVDILEIYSSPGEIAKINYSSQFNNDSIRVVLVNANNEAVDIVKGSGNGSIDATISGKSVIKGIGNNATGNLKIDVTFGETASVGQYNEDGIFVISDCEVNGGMLNGSIHRIKVINKKVDKIATIKLNGKLENGMTTFQFADDGWGNSGSVEFEVLSDNRLRFKVTLTKTNFEMTEWGFTEGDYITNGEPLPAYLNGI